MPAAAAPSTTAFPPRARLLLGCIVALLAALAATARDLDASRPPGEVRALWVTRASLTSAAAIDALVSSARASGFNTLVVQVRGRGDAYYANALEPRADPLAAQPAEFDPLQHVIDRAGGEGLRVHAWVNINLVASAAELPASRAHIVYRHPEWLMVPRALAYELARVGSRSPEFLGRLARWTRANDQIEGLFASPALPDVAAHVTAVVEDLVKRYPVDGVHLDYIRYPGPDFDYNLGVLREFHSDLLPSMDPAERRRVDPRSISDLTALTDIYADRWAGFRRSRLNALVLRLRTVVKTHRPGAVLSAAVFPDATEAAAHRFQDWRFWVENRWLDVVCPMAYTPDASMFADQIALVRQVAGPGRVWAGIGAYRLTTARTIENIEAARRLGAQGVILFSYDSLVEAARGRDALASIGRAAFAP